MLPQNSCLFILSKLETNNERLGLMPQKTFILESRNQNENKPENPQFDEHF